MRPLADAYRPVLMDEVVGQGHIIGKGKLLSRMAEHGNIPNLIFHGPPGTGKTTVANIIAESSGMEFHKLNATNASITDIRNILKNRVDDGNKRGILLYLDEIQYFNKKQQQSLLPFIESGEITLIASTTENPYYSLFTALLSRATVFQFREITSEDIIKNMKRVIMRYEQDNGVSVRISGDNVQKIAYMANGDVRKSINALDILFSSTPVNCGIVSINDEDVSHVAQKSSMRYDRDGNEHYETISAFQKSIRGSDTDAALHYLARLIYAEDIQSICRRLMVIVAEDIGLAYPQAVVITKACVDSAVMLGLPEARIPLAEAVIMLSESPKSNSALTAIDAALSDVKNGNAGEIPAYLKNSHFKDRKGNEYKYPHDFSNNWVRQQYMPDVLKDRKYYVHGDNKFEKGAEVYWDSIKKQ